MTAVTSDLAVPRDRRAGAWRLTGWLALALLAVGLASLTWGASDASPWVALAKLWQGEALTAVEKVVLLNIRLPRLAMSALVGAGLAMSGAILQGLFRNPLADPGIVGVTSGGTLGAIGAIVLGGLLPLALRETVGTSLVSVAAFVGAWFTTILLYRVATRDGQTSVPTMLLAGIALAALAMAMAGILVYMADDAQLRDLTFWSMGSMAGATWAKVATSLPILALALLASPLISHGLNGIALGEAAAMHMGVEVQKTKTLAVLWVAGATGVAVAVAGAIGFVGIVVPHLLRLASGPDHTPLLPNAALLGAILMISADMIARTIVAPAELPIGIVTAVLGAPVFLWILLRRRGLVGME
ncbi:FecCD family ABC transporter permease [Chachezhania sediminis]|uniref:FecCD family ABC transporter permease n=1 Tax=Chachezhania sediminis TaxID=2599291 RepID=UPI00131DA4F5|nr:iron ABC transporter permease [Chachezhania sediminis]